MTDAKNKDEWIKAWTGEARYLTRAYQCRADPDLFDGLDFAIKAVVAMVEEIGERMELEGEWSKTSMKNIKRAYDEARNCGYVGSIVDYCLSVGVKLEDLA